MLNTKKINNNIEESYCSLEVSKLLKEKNFFVLNKPREYHFKKDNGGMVLINADSWESELHKNYQNENYFLVPHHSLAIEWIRVNFDIHIEIASYFNKPKLNKRFYEAGISHEENGYEGLMFNASQRIQEDWTKEPEKYWLFNSPQEAKEAALKYCLTELIK